MTLPEYTKFILEIKRSLTTGECLKTGDNYLIPVESFQKILPTQSIQDSFVHSMRACGMKMTGNSSFLIIPVDELDRFWNALASFCEPLVLNFLTRIS